MVNTQTTTVPSTSQLPEIINTQTTPTTSQPSHVGFLQDDKGNNSAMRLMSLIALITSIAFGSYTITNSKEIGSVGTNLTLIFLTASFGGKAIQKFAEEQK